MWHRLEWPPVERLTGESFDVTHSLHPLLMPSSRAARIVTIHDSNFLSHPERTRAEIRRDYPVLARNHAHRADRILVPSQFTAGEVERRLDVNPDRISVCSFGAPDWQPRTQRPARPEDGYTPFLGTLEPRKNIGTLLDAYERMLSRASHDPRDRPTSAAVPELVLAGMATSESTPWLDRIARPPLAGHVRHIGYVDPDHRQTVYAGAHLLVQPSFEEGFGIPVLEAMTLGVPVVAANRGALPEVLGDAGLLVSPESAEEMARAIERMTREDGLAASCVAKGLVQARRFQWTITAERVVHAYHQAVSARNVRLRAA